MKRLISLLAVAAALSLSPAHGQTFPEKRVTLVIPFSPGAANDILGRYLAEALSKRWGQPVTVENRPGAGGAIGSNIVAKSKPDGYTLAFSSSSYTTNSVVLPNLPFDPVKDLKPVAIAAKGQMVVVTGTRVPLPTLAELAKQAKAQTIFYGANGASLATFAAELFNNVANIRMEAVNYRGGTEILTDMIGGRMDAYFATVTTILPQVRDKRVTAVAVLSKTRSPQLPDVPTVAEAGFAGAEAEIWWGLFAPAGLPDALLAQLHRDASEVMSTPEAKEFLAKQGTEPAPMPQSEFEALVNFELKRWREIAEKHGIKG